MGRLGSNAQLRIRLNNDSSLFHIELLSDISWVTSSNFQSLCPDGLRSLNNPTEGSIRIVLKTAPTHYLISLWVMGPLLFQHFLFAFLAIPQPDRVPKKVAGVSLVDAFVIETNWSNGLVVVDQRFRTHVLGRVLWRPFEVIFRGSKTAVFLDLSAFKN